MPPKKINVGKCVEEQKGYKAYQDLYLSTLKPGEKFKRETPTPRPCAGKLLTYATTQPRTTDSANIPKLNLNLIPKRPPSPKQQQQQTKKESPKKHNKSRDESSLTSPKTTQRSPPKGLLFHTTSATTVLQGLKDPPSTLTKRDLQNSIFSQDPNVDGTKTQRIIQWLRDCAVAQEHSGPSDLPLLAAPSNSALLETDQCSSKWTDDGKKSAKAKSKIPLKGHVTADKKLAVSGKAVEKRKRSNVDLGVANEDVETRRNVLRQPEVPDVSTQVKKVKNWNRESNPANGAAKRQQKIKDNRQVGKKFVSPVKLDEEERKCAKQRRSSNFLVKSDVSWLQREKQLKCLTKETICFEQLRMLRENRWNWWIPMRKASMTNAGGEKAKRRKGCQACAVASSVSVDAGWQIRNGLKRKVFNALLEHLISRKVLEAQMQQFYLEKLTKRHFHTWKSFAAKRINASRATFKKLQERNLLSNSFAKWKELAKPHRKPPSLKKDDSPHDKLTEFIIMTTSRIREINKTISPNRKKIESPSSEKTIANLSHGTQKSKSLQSGKSSTCSSTKTLQLRAKTASKSDTKPKRKSAKDDVKSVPKQQNSVAKAKQSKENPRQRSSTAIPTPENPRKMAAKPKIDVDRKKKMDDVYKKQVNFVYSHIVVN